MDDVRPVLQKAEAHLRMIDALYGADLELQRVSPTLRGKIRAFVETEKSALDTVAQGVVAADVAEAHYPLAPDPATIDAFLDKFVPGVREARPDTAAAIARHQPYGVPALAHLREMLLEEKWQRLTPRTRPAPVVDEPVEEPVAEGPPAPPPPPPRQSGGTGGGLTGSVFINGIEYDPVTMQPLNPPPAPKRDTIYEDWLFELEGGEVSALQALQAIHAAVSAAVDEISPPS